MISSLTLGAKPMAGSIPVAIANDQTLLVTPPIPSTTVRASVAAAAADTLLIAVRFLRRGFMIQNDGTTVLHLAYGTAAASLTDYTVQVPAGGFYQDVHLYTGQVRGIWAGAPTGNARITELIA